MNSWWFLQRFLEYVDHIMQILLPNNSIVPLGYFELVCKDKFDMNSVILTNHEV